MATTGARGQRCRPVGAETFVFDIAVGSDRVSIQKIGVSAAAFITCGCEIWDTSVADGN